MNHDNRWHEWFAWRPVFVDTRSALTLVFRETVMRRRIFERGRYRWKYTFPELTN